MNTSSNAPMSRIAIWIIAALVVAVFGGLFVGISIGYVRGLETGRDAGWDDCLAAQAKGPAAIWRNPDDGTVLVFRDFTGSSMKPNWQVIYDTLVKDDVKKTKRVIGKTIEVQLRGKVPGQVMGRLALKTNTGWIIQVQLNDIEYERWQDFANSAMILSAGVIHGKSIEPATKVALAAKKSEPKSFRD